MPRIKKKWPFKSKVPALYLAALLLATCGQSDFDFAAEGDRVDLKDHFGRDYNNAQKMIEAALIQAKLQVSTLQNATLDDVSYSGFDGSAVDTAYTTEESSVDTGEYNFTWNADVEFASTDGTLIRGNIFIPEQKAPGEIFPAIVFVNSWSLDEHEYIVQAAKFAKKGYIVLSYSTRGFGFSEGKINVAGPKDMEDLDAALDWLEGNSPVDTANIGMSGISYGAGISLLGLAMKDRVKTAVAMSGWTSLLDALWGGQTPRLVWGALLISIGYITGRMDPVILENFGNMLSYQNIDDTKEWAAQRSAATYVDRINAKNKPVYIANNFQDDLFQPNMILDFYARLSGPKKLDLNQGMHASAEMAGLIGLDNYIWNNTHDWFDHFLKGEDTGILDKPAVTMEKKLNGSNERVSLADWPAPNGGNRRFELRPRTTIPWRAGELVNGANTLSKQTTYYSGLDTLASTGFPLLSPILEAHLDVPVKLDINDFTISRVNGVYYMSDDVDAALTIAGTPALKLSVTPNKSQAMVVAYLYDVDSSGKGTLITHGTFSLHEAVKYEKTDVNVNFVSTAYDLPAGHRLAVAIDTFDVMYAVPTLSVYKMKINHSTSNPNVLNIPYVD